MRVWIVLFVLRVLVYGAKLAAKRTRTDVDDKIIERLDEILNLISKPR